jgi:hypothetical protein
MTDKKNSSTHNQERKNAMKHNGILAASMVWLSSAQQSISSSTHPHSGRECLVSSRPFFGLLC